eukprot:1962224-Lingulodinium_polyedra.AAC.1
MLRSRQWASPRSPQRTLAWNAQWAALWKRTTGSIVNSATQSTETHLRKRHRHTQRAHDGHNA